MDSFSLLFTLFCLGLVGWVAGKEINSIAGKNESVSHREGKFFPFYTIGRFTRNACVGSRNTLMGTCIVKGECDDIGGVNTGACDPLVPQAICCVYQKSCGAQTQVNNTYFYNPSYPQTYAGGASCSYRVTRAATDICQLRIDFLDFSLAQPNGDGLCNQDYFSVAGGNSQVPRICGENTGQHVYVDFNGDNPITITMLTTAGFVFNRRWHFRMSQIDCNSEFRAPSGCLQYFLDSTGFVKSFNYANGANPSTNTQGVEGTRQIQSMRYGACVRMAAGQCSITWTLPSTDPYAFTVTGDVGAVDPAMLGMAALSDNACTTDYVIIPTPISADGVTTFATDRFCGLGFPGVTSRVKPFTIYSVTDANELNDISNRGFYLTYAQVPCPVV